MAKLKPILITAAIALIVMAIVARVSSLSKIVLGTP
jgi:hypothetical protein